MAYIRTNNQVRDYELTPDEYSELKIKASQYASEYFKIAYKYNLIQHPNKDKKRSRITSQKISKALKGKERKKGIKKKQSTKDKMSRSARNKVFSTEHKLHLKEARAHIDMSGKNNPMYNTVSPFRGKC